MSGSRTVDDQARSFQNAAAGELPVPANIALGSDERVYWAVIMRARARDEWAESDLYIAAELARTLADQERIRRALAEEGDTLVNGRGTVTANPRHGLLEVIARRVLVLRKDLLISSAKLAPTGTDAATLVPKRTEEARERAALARSGGVDDDGDDLLAAPLRH